jgi:hypothetical protein
VTALGVTPGWLRSENMLEGFGITEESWRDALDKTPGFAISESPTYVARGVAALTQDSEVAQFAGQVLTARQLADRYGVTDTDGSRRMPGATSSPTEWRNKAAGTSSGSADRTNREMASQPVWELAEAASCPGRTGECCSRTAGRVGRPASALLKRPRIVRWNDPRE